MEDVESRTDGKHQILKQVVKYFAARYLVKQILAVKRMNDREQVWAANFKAGNDVCLHTCKSGISWTSLVAIKDRVRTSG